METFDPLRDTNAIGPDELRQRVGSLTRTLHDALRQLGYDRDLQDARENLPDARDRLNYIARLTGDAADKVLNAVDVARSVQEDLSEQSRTLSRRWDAVEAFTVKGGRATPAGEELVSQTREFCERIERSTDRTNEILTEIMLAQDFHDLTGQVIRRVVDVAQQLESNLVKLLIETAPAAASTSAAPAVRREPEAAAPSGPVVKPDGRHDVVTNQEQVDDLLAQLGF
ncbi:MAG: protein phosphatase CheZ [Burkholderiaceae bacterium]